MEIANQLFFINIFIFAFEQTWRYADRRFAAVANTFRGMRLQDEQIRPHQG
jgi:hypothetical protein